jgi:hypothetical protein
VMSISQPDFSLVELWVRKPLRLLARRMARHSESIVCTKEFLNKESLTITDNRSGASYEVPLFEGNGRKT